MATTQVPPSPVRPGHRGRRGATALVAAALVAGAGGLASQLTGLAPWDAGAAGPPGGPTGARQAAVQSPAVPAPVTDPVARAQAQADAAPRDPGAWSALGFAALEVARATSDPARYAQAQEAFDRSLIVRPTGNVNGLAGRAALDDARHDFAAGQRVAEQALAVDPISPVALAALTDALTELGRYPQALAAAQRLDAAQPGVSSFSRLSYQDELRGDVAGARNLLQRAASVADTGSEVAFARAQEGLLDLAAGEAAGARSALTAGLQAAPDDTGLLHLKARVEWATGDTAAARSDYAELVRRRPTPAWTTEQGELLASLGDAAGAATAFDLTRVGYRLNSGSGIAVDAGHVLFEADHGSAATAAALGARLWAAAPSVTSADAYAWALHRAGRDAQALPIARRAVALGGASGPALQRAAATLAATGHRAEAATLLRRARPLTLAGPR